MAQNSFKQNNNVKFDNFADDVDDASDEIDVGDTNDVSQNDESSLGYSGKP